MKKYLISIVFYLALIFPIKSGEKIAAIFEGNMNAKVKIIVFESLTCSHCGNFHRDVYPDLKENFIDNGLVNIEFRNFPLDMAALNASKIAHCKNDGNPKILHFLFKNQKKWTKGETLKDFNSNLREVIENENLGIDFDKCISNKQVEDYILEDRINAVKKFEIKSTPTIIINNKKFDKTINYKNLKKTIEKLI